MTLCDNFSFLALLLGRYALNMKEGSFYQSRPMYVIKANKWFDFSYRRLITDSKVKLKYQHLITNSFVEVSFEIFFLLNSMLKWNVKPWFIMLSCQVILYALLKKQRPSLYLCVNESMSWYSISHYSFKCNRLLKWCPAPDCHHVVKVQYPDAKPVRCKCGRQFW